MEKYYKLYSLVDNKLYSRFGDRNNIELDKAYYAHNSSHKLCFANINHILDYKNEHGIVVCDIEPVDEVFDSVLSLKVESESMGIIPRNPRYIYSPEFIKELIFFGNNDAWLYVSDESYVKGAIECPQSGMCYDVNLSFELSKSLQLLLLDTYDNGETNGWFEHRRPGFNYEDIYKMIKKDRASRKIVIDAWNIYAPCKKSKILKVISIFLANGINSSILA